MLPYVFLIIFLTLQNAVRCKLVYKTAYAFTVERVPANPDRYPITAIQVSDEDHVVGRDRAFPGPPIRARKGDLLEVTVHNAFDDETTSVHFHGLHMTDNPWMDGVAGLTQHPIPPMSSFTYRFNATQTGTFWYHSHSGHQYAGGLLGPLIVDYRIGEQDPVKISYPYTVDEVIILQDWFHENEHDLYINYRGPYNAFGRRKRHQGDSHPIYQPNYPWKPHSLLLNGRGNFDCSTMNESRTCFSHSFCQSSEQCIRERKPLLQECRSEPYPVEEFLCGGRFIRLRLINGAANVPFKLWIDKHELIIVARDGIETKPLTRKYVIIPVGQRLDVMVPCTGTQFPSVKFNIFVTVAIAYLPDNADNPRIDTFVTGLLTYPPGTGSVVEPDFLPVDDPTRSSGGEMFEYQLEPLTEETAPPADERIVLQYGEVSSVIPGEPLEEWTIDGITHIMPKLPLLQAMYFEEPLNQTVRDLGAGPMGNKRRTHIRHLQYNRTYDFVVIGASSQQHPWHLHGYTMSFVAAGTLNRSTDFELGAKDECGCDGVGTVKKAALDAMIDWREPAKILTKGDSFTVPRYGYAIFRVKMVNQGPWLFHCHVDWHLGMGMAMIFSVERDGRYPDIQAPPVDFPAYLPMSGFRPAGSSHTNSGTSIGGQAQVVAAWLAVLTFALVQIYRG
ncbi:putative L-ascorbate oxidase [Hypsibius exemplaris]|uniref:L-ascorbate oxidase n=1 Tax=Hypsibius exemplaris TaxID=2072580 RepID=A0A1W0WKB7_HYPEX|nr:putative L-ascorbate oxidase [Hypsibius exemplaris]